MGKAAESEIGQLELSEVTGPANLQALSTKHKAGSELSVSHSGHRIKEIRLYSGQTMEKRHRQKTQLNNRQLNLEV